MNLSDEIRKQIEKNKGLKLAVGEINNHLSILENLVRKDIMEQVDDAYQKGLEEGKKEAESSEAIEQGKMDAFNEGMLFKGEKINDAYKRGLEDGKAVNDKGCEGCKLQGTDSNICDQCCNSYANQWTAKDDKIEVGDEVNWIGDCFIVTRIFQPHNMKEQCDGIGDDGCVYHDVLMDDLEKTGRHFDIASILEEMRHDS